MKLRTKNTRQIGVATIWIAFVFSGHAQTTNMGCGFYQPEATICITPKERSEIKAKISASITALRVSGKLPSMQSQLMAAAPTFGWPIQQVASNTDYGVHGISNFVDQNTNATLTIDFQCGARSYDGHLGTDIFLWPFQWWKMDHNEVQVVAAAPGTIAYKSNGNLDRNCIMGGATWNAVFITHADGSIAWYGHLKNGSLTSKAIGESVEEGEYLGIVGSSGNSTGPHMQPSPTYSRPEYRSYLRVRAEPKPTALFLGRSRI